MEVTSMNTITKDMVIGDLLALDQNFAAILMASGMHCVGCPSSQGETLEEAAFVHGMNVDELLGRLNEYMETKQA
jgi:hybrid cluster-associated redox disulfide protein